MVRLRRRGVDLLESVHEGVLGTQLSLKVRDANVAKLRAARTMVLGEIDRLESIFSVYRPESELSRWKRAPLDTPMSDELSLLLRRGHDWFVRSRGVFNPSVGVLSERWQQAGREQRVPEAAELSAMAVTMAELPYSHSADEGWVLTSACAPLNFNALAKGLLIDLVCGAVVDRLAPMSIVINIGGDLVHAGDGAAAVAIEDPHRAYDNAVPLDRVVVGNVGVATSGLAKRGVRLGDDWFSHVIDPRTGWPVDAVSSATVVAPTAATADAIATVLSVLAPAEGVQFATTCGDDVACLVVGADRSVTTNHRWTLLRR
jgi:FAD:protein FMN transferase